MTATDKMWADAQAGDEIALHRLSMAFEGINDPDKVGKCVELLESNQERLGDSTLHNLALLLRRLGRPDEAIINLKAAASMEHVPSMFKLGKHYEYSAEKDLCEAIKHYSMAADRGHFLAKKRILHHKYRVKGFPAVWIYWLSICALSVKMVVVILRNQKDPRLIY